MSFIKTRDQAMRSAAAGGLVGHAAPTFRARSGTEASGTTSLNTGTPAGAATGDLLICWIQTGNGGGLSMSATGGQTWTNLINNTEFKCWWAIHNGSLGTVTLAQTNTNTIAVGMAAITAGTFDATTPIDATVGVNNTTGTNAAVPSVTTTMENVLRLCIAYFNGVRFSELEYYTSEPAGFTKRYNSQYSGWSYTVYVGTKVSPTAGATSGEAFVNGNVYYAIGHIPIRPA